MVRNGVVQDPIDWRWSSYHAHAFGADDPILDFHELYLLLAEDCRQCQEIYRCMVEERIREKGLRREPALVDGLVVGSQSFVAKIVEEYGKRITFYKDRPIGSQGDLNFLRRKRKKA